MKSEKCPAIDAATQIISAAHIEDTEFYNLPFFRTIDIASGAMAMRCKDCRGQNDCNLADRNGASRKKLLEELALPSQSKKQDSYQDFLEKYSRETTTWEDIGNFRRK